MQRNVKSISSLAISVWEKNSNSAFETKVNLPDVQQKAFAFFSNILIL